MDICLLKDAAFFYQKNGCLAFETTIMYFCFRRSLSFLCSLDPVPVLGRRASVLFFKAADEMGKVAVSAGKANIRDAFIAFLNPFGGPAKAKVG